MTDPRPFGYPAGVPRPKLPKEAVLAPQMPVQRVKKAPSAKDLERRRKAEERAERFLLLLAAHGLPRPHREYRFHDTRMWRFDFAWPQQSVALEVDGGIFTGGGHVRGAHILTTHEKMNAAASMGWRVLYTVPKTLCTEELMNIVHDALRWSPK